MSGPVWNQCLHRGWKNSNFGSINHSETRFLRKLLYVETFPKAVENITLAFTSLNTMASSFSINENQFEVQHTVQSADTLYFPQLPVSIPKQPGCGVQLFPWQHHT